VQSDPIGLGEGINTYIHVASNPLSRKDPLGLKDFSDECTGRYANCREGQDPKASAFGNWVRWRICKAGIDNICEKGPAVCCETDRKARLGGLSADGADAQTPEDRRKVGECNATFANCLFRAGKKN
jgi:hypothetical protein